MLRYLQNWLIQRAVHRALQHPPPKGFFDGEAVGNPQYFYYVMFHDPETGLKFFVHHLTPHGAEGVVRNKNQVGEPFAASLPLKYFRDFTLEIRHYYRAYEIKHSSAWRFFVAEMVNYAYWHRRNDLRLQRKFNAQELVRYDRMKVLNHFLTRTIADRRYANSSIGIITELYGNRWALHPDEENIQNYYSLVVQSLKESGDLTNTESIYYRVAPKALNTLDTYAEEGARHSENTGIQRRIVYLTVALAVIAAAQIGVTVWQEVHPDPVSTPAS